MGNEITCPRCRRSTLPQNRYCEHCGVDLMVAASLVEQEFTLPASLSTGMPVVPEILVPRIGDYMIEQGVLSAQDLQRALEYQKECLESGKPVLLGQALLELNMVRKEILDQVVTLQILRLQTALSEANHSLQERVRERTQDLQKAMERLSELNQLKSNFISNISHELRTPLTHIKGYLDLLIEGELGPLNDKQSDAMRVMRAAEQRLEQLIEDLIQFSLASQGQLTLDQDDFDLSELVKIIIERIRPKARAKNIQITSQIYTANPLVHADREKIGWSLTQLMDNAVKFTPEGGKVICEISDVDGMLVTRIIDTGIGIPPERIQEIFEPFHQLNGTATRRYAGTGLGLAMVRRIIENHGTQVKVKSTVGKGSQFEFQLPSSKLAAIDQPNFVPDTTKSNEPSE